MANKLILEQPAKATSVGRTYTFHLLGYVHLPVTEHYMGCAFTQKVVKMAQMLTDLGHIVYLYGAEGSEAPCTEFIQTHTMSQIKQEWGDGDNRFSLGYDWRSEGFRHDFNEQRTATTMRFYEAAIKGINERKMEDDFLLVMQGAYHKPIAQEVNLWLTCEPGIGYRGPYARFQAYESAYLRNFVAGSDHPRQSIDGDWYHRVIPNYFNPDHFPFQVEKEDYFFYIGRLIQRKGVWIAERVADALGKRLVVAGQDDYKFTSPHVEQIGYIDPADRAKWMGGAQAVFVPTVYLEAFGGVNVEAQLCGTPVITTDFGVFPETVINGITGFRCNTLQDFVDAANRVGELDPHVIRAHAERYLMGNVQWEYQQWFDDLYRLYESIGQPPGTIYGWNYLREKHDD